MKESDFVYSIIDETYTEEGISIKFPQLNNTSNPTKGDSINKAINDEVNYFDTTYVYPGSEATFGEILKINNCRDKIYIATKLPKHLYSIFT